MIDTTTQDHIDMLLCPRVRVIANYPFMEYNIGDVLTLHRATIPYYSIVETKTISEAWVLLCPNIFNSINWADDRNFEDLPKYLKSNMYWKPLTDNTNHVEIKKGEIIEVDEYSTENTFDIDRWRLAISSFTPATRIEYETYLKQNK